MVFAWKHVAPSTGVMAYLRHRQRMEFNLLQLKDMKKESLSTGSVSAQRCTVVRTICKLTNLFVLHFDIICGRKSLNFNFK